MRTSKYNKRKKGENEGRTRSAYVLSRVSRALPRHSLLASRSPPTLVKVPGRWKDGEGGPLVENGFWYLGRRGAMAVVRPTFTSAPLSPDRFRRFRAIPPSSTKFHLSSIAPAAFPIVVPSSSRLEIVVHDPRRPSSRSSRCYSRRNGVRRGG